MSDGDIRRLIADYVAAAKMAAAVDFPIAIEPVNPTTITFSPCLIEECRPRSAPAIPA